MDLTNRLREHLERELPQTPTKGQLTLVGELASFLMSSEIAPLFVMLGYAGTGKTTVVSALVKSLPVVGMKFVLLAPTGRAAKVLSGYSGSNAFTIHKYIYAVRSSGDSFASMSLKINVSKNTVFIVDEASMIPDVNNSTNDFNHNSLLDDLVSFVYEGDNCRLLLVGDTAQLPPVGVNYSPALDVDFLKSSFNLNVNSYELTEVVRQPEFSGILANATLLRKKIKKESITPPFFNVKEHNDISMITGMELEDALVDAYSRSGAENVIVICRSNKRAVLFNNEIRNRILFREELLNAGDLLMVVKNNYFFLPKDSAAGFIANGDIIEVLRIKRSLQMYGRNFAEATVRLIDYPDEKDMEVLLMTDTLGSDTPSLSYSEYKNLYEAIAMDYEDIPLKYQRMKNIRENIYLNALQVKYSYALTCHKTQGGQWETVFIDQGYLTKEMINVEYLRWLYTAETRATGKLYLVGFNEDFFAG